MGAAPSVIDVTSAGLQLDDLDTSCRGRDPRLNEYSLRPGQELRLREVFVAGIEHFLERAPARRHSEQVGPGDHDRVVVAPCAPRIRRNVTDLDSAPPAEGTFFSFPPAKNPIQSPFGE